MPKRSPSSVTDLAARRTDRQPSDESKPWWPDQATEEEVYEALREHAVAAWEAHGAPADHPIDEEWGREMARKIMEKRK